MHPPCEFNPDPLYAIRLFLGKRGREWNTTRFLASRIPLEIQDILLRDTCAVISMRLTRTFAGRRPAVGESSRVLDIRGAQLAPLLLLLENRR